MASLAGIVPDGLLVFFPSYYVLERSIDYWKNSGGGAPYARLWSVFSFLSRSAMPR